MDIFGDVGDVIGDALNINGYLEPCDNGAEIVAHGLTECQQSHSELVDFTAQRVDPVVFVNDLF